MESNFRKMHSALAEAYMVLVKAHMDECPIPEDVLVHVITTLESALAIKPRNCDVGTAEEQQRRFRMFCGRMHPCHKCPISKIRVPNDVETPCGMIWAQMPYEAEEESVKEERKET